MPVLSAQSRAPAIALRNAFVALAIALAAMLFAPVALAASKSSALLPLDKAAMQRTVETMARDMLVPGVVVILGTPAGETRLTYGTTTFHGTEKVTANQRIRVGSNTKTWTGTVILQQVQEGRLRLDDPVSKFRQDVPNGDNITITQLLDMRSGLYNYSETEELNQTLDREPGKAWTQHELLALAFKHPPYFAPGAGYHYSNTNIIVLGLIAEQLEGGKPLAKIFEDRLFKPLKLTATLLPSTTSSTIAGPRSHGYMYGDNVLTMGSPPALPAAMQAAAKAGTLRPNDYTDANPSWAWSAGAGISTANELFTWVRALVGGTLLNAEMQKKRLDSMLPLDPTNGAAAQYGLGLAKMGPFYGHTGELPGYNSFMGHDPVNDVTLVVWSNLGPAVDGRDPASTIARALMAHVYAP